MALALRGWLRRTTGTWLPRGGALDAGEVVISQRRVFIVPSRAGLGFVLLLAMTAAWGVVFSGFMQLIALKSRSAAATQSGTLVFFPLLFLTPNFVPRELLSRPMEIAASINPVTYVMEALRSLILEDLDWTTIGWGVLVIAVLAVLMLALSLRAINRYD